MGKSEGRSKRFGIFRPSPRNEVNDELSFHLEQRVRDNMARGMDEDAARAEARARLGDLDGVRQECVELATVERRRDERHERLRFSWLDFKLGFRMLARYPGLTIVGGLAMAFAIAVGAAAFEAIRQIAHPTLPFPEAERLVAVRLWDTFSNRRVPQIAHEYLEWRDQLRSIDELAAFRNIRRNLITYAGDAAPQFGAEISASAFEIVSASPLLGRVLLPSDQDASASPVVLIGYDVWQTHFGGDPGAVGRTVQLGGVPTTVVGVMPEGFRFPVAHDLWVPLRLNVAGVPRGEGPGLAVFGRLAAGVGLQEAQAELTTVGRRTAAAFPDLRGHVEPLVAPYFQDFLPVSCGAVGWTRCMSLTQAGLYSSNLGFLLFLALVCANVALLMFARASARESEIIVRSALGASRSRIVAQLVAEALVLGAVAAVIGLGAARLALEIALKLLRFVDGGGGEVPFWWQATLSWSSVLYAAGLTLVGATIAGVLPALKVTRGRTVRLRQTGAGGLHFGGFWTVVIVAQISCTVLFVATTTYVTVLSSRVSSFELGFPASEYLSARIQLSDGISAEAYAEIERRLLAEPAVSGVTFASALPGAYHGRQQLQIDGVGGAVAQVGSVDPGFFDVLKLRIVAGRGFAATDADSEVPAIVVNEQFVERVLGGGNAIGRRVRFIVAEDVPDPWGPWHTIVGVVQQVAMGVDPEMTPAGLYWPLRRTGTSVYLAVHAAPAPERLADRLPALVAATLPELQVSQVQRLDRVRDGEAGFYRTWARVLAGASFLVLALSLAGIYAIMSFTVSRRTREIGIRVALGANRRRIVASVFRRPLIQVAAGVLIGMGIIVAMLRGIPSVQVGLLLGAFTLVIFAVCLLACVVPTRRALEIEPTEALRAEPGV